MADKKNEDYVVRMPESSDAFSEKGFVSRSSTFSSRVGHGANQQQQLNINQLDNSPGLSILAYCLASISMTVVNKYVVSGSAWNLNFLYLAIQVCQLRAGSNANAANAANGQLTPNRRPLVHGLHIGHPVRQAGRPDQAPVPL